MVAILGEYMEQLADLLDLVKSVTIVSSDFAPYIVTISVWYGEIEEYSGDTLQAAISAALEGARVIT